MDRVILSGILCRIRIGVTEEERREPQDCLVDVELGTNLARPMQTDDLHDSIDYAQVFALVHELAREEEFSLLERFAGRLEGELRQRCRFDEMTLRVKKLRPPLPGRLEFAGIEVRRP
jgi:dihydroneopterin aldolase